MNGKEMERDKPMYDTYMLLRFLRMHVRPAANSLHRAYSEEHDILSWVIYWWPSHDQNGIRLPTYSLSEMFGQIKVGILCIRLASDLPPSTTRFGCIHACVASLVECYEMVLAIIVSVPENVWDECYCTCSSYLHKSY